MFWLYSLLQKKIFIKKIKIKIKIKIEESKVMIQLQGCR
jgi:hypothetical protein